MVMEVLGSAVGSTRERGIEDTLHADSRPPSLQVYIILEHLDRLDEDQKFASAIVERRCCCNSMQRKALSLETHKLPGSLTISKAKIP